MERDTRETSAQVMSFSSHFARGGKKCCCNLLNLTLQMSQSQMSGGGSTTQTWLVCVTLQRGRMAEAAPFHSAKKCRQQMRICLCPKPHWMQSTLTAESPSKTVLKRREWPEHPSERPVHPLTTHEQWVPKQFPIKTGNVREPRL